MQDFFSFSKDCYKAYFCSRDNQQSLSFSSKTLDIIICSCIQSKGEKTMKVRQYQKQGSDEETGPELLTRVLIIHFMERHKGV